MEIGIEIPVFVVKFVIRCRIFFKMLQLRLVGITMITLGTSIKLDIRKTRFERREGTA
jgi:hypothetical protein